MSEKREYDSFIFTHIPKCGGTSFRKFINDAALKSGVSEEEIYIPGFNGLPNEKNLAQLNEDELKELRKRKIRVLACHSKFNDHEIYNLNISNPFYYTILREPVERFISHYNFFNYKLGYNECKDQSLGDLDELKRSTLINKLSNVQTHHIANVKSFRAVGMDNVLRVAKYNLLFEYSCFGVLEMIHDSNKKLSAKIPEWIEIQTDFPKSNINEELSKQISELILEEIREANQYDIDLYKFALKHF